MKAFVIVLLAYAVSLQLFFPGYFRPLTPHHNDFYFPPGLSFDGHSLLEKLTWPRPLGFVAFQFLGRLGLHGYLFVLVVIALVNAGLMIALVTRLVGRRVSWLAAIVYCLLLFAHPDFYVDYLHDAFATLSCLYLLLGLHAWLEYRDHGKVRYAVACVALMLLLAFTKETYFLTALFLWLVAAVFSRGSVRKASVAILAVSLVLFIAAFFTNAYSLKHVVQLQAGAAEPYQVTLAPAILARVALFYLSNLFSLTSLFTVVAALALTYEAARKHLLEAAAFFVAGLCAVLPHAALPNHIDSMYAWTGAIFAFAPVLFVPFFGWPRINLAVVQVGLAGLLMGLYIRGNAPRYAAHSWTIEQERINGNIIAAFPKLKAVGGGGKNLLIAGLGMPFHPFRTASYVRAEFGADKQWTVVIPRGELPKYESPVRTEKADTVNPSAYDHSFGFDDDGFLIKEQTHEQLQGASGEEARDRVMMPALNPIFDRREKWSDQWLPVLRVGQIYWQWGAAEKAAQYMERSAEIDGFHNPYPFFFLGQIREEQGKLAEAAQYYDKAVTLDGSRPNPVFREALERVRKK